RPVTGVIVARVERHHAVRHLPPVQTFLERPADVLAHCRVEVRRVFVDVKGQIDTVHLDAEGETRVWEPWFYSQADSRRKGVGVVGQPLLGSTAANRALDVDNRRLSEVDVDV